ncbi:MAG TPA: hypothetical protein VHP11_17520, partial [Tepidisphaeraceae bacterium]|nr:hypothetical protein [Tepidisphaeraceae bacterium]
DYRSRAAAIYAEYTRQYAARFKWIRPGLFGDLLGKDLKKDAAALMDVLRKSGPWNPAGDAKLDALADLLTVKHPSDKVLIFTQFADTVDYLVRQLKARGIRQIEGVSGDSADPTGIAWRFSPASNNRRDRTPPTYFLDGPFEVSLDDGIVVGVRRPQGS